MSKINGTIRFLDLKNIDLDTKIVILRALVQKLRSQVEFCKMVSNVTRSGTSHFQTAQDNFNLLKGFYSSYLVLKFGRVLPFMN